MKKQEKTPYWKFFLGVIVVLFVIAILNAKFIVKHFEFLRSVENIHNFVGIGILTIFVIFNYFYQSRTIRIRKKKREAKYTNSFPIDLQEK